MVDNEGHTALFAILRGDAPPVDALVSAMLRRGSVAAVLRDAVAFWASHPQPVLGVNIVNCQRAIAHCLLHAPLTEAQWALVPETTVDEANPFIPAAGVGVLAGLLSLVVARRDWEKQARHVVARLPRTAQRRLRDKLRVACALPVPRDAAIRIAVSDLASDLLVLTNAM